MHGVLKVERVLVRRRDDDDAVVQSDGLDDEAEMKNKKTESDAAVNPATASPRTPGLSGSPDLLQRNSLEHPEPVAAAGSSSPGALLWCVHDDCPHALAVLAPAPYGATTRPRLPTPDARRSHAAAEQSHWRVNHRFRGWEE